MLPNVPTSLPTWPVRLKVTCLSRDFGGVQHLDASRPTKQGRDVTPTLSESCLFLVHCTRTHTHKMALPRSLSSGLLPSEIEYIATTETEVSIVPLIAFDRVRLLGVSFYLEYLLCTRPLTHKLTISIASAGTVRAFQTSCSGQCATMASLLSQKAEEMSNRASHLANSW